MSHRIRNLAVSIALVSITGCAHVLSNDGRLVVIDWDPSTALREEAHAVATKSCQEVGKKTATPLTDVSANPALASWLVKRRLTFECT